MGRTRIDLSNVLHEAEHYTEQACYDADEGNYSKAIEKFKKSNKLLLKVYFASGNIENFKPTSYNSDGLEKELLDFILNQVYLNLSENCYHLLRIYSNLGFPEECLKYIEYATEIYSLYMKNVKRADSSKLYLRMLSNSIFALEEFDERSEIVKYVSKFMEAVFETFKSGYEIELKEFLLAQGVFDIFFQLVEDNLMSIEEAIDTLYQSLVNTDISPEDDNFDLWQSLALYTLDNVTSQNPEVISKERNKVLAILTNFIEEFVKDDIKNIEDMEEVLEIVLHILRTLSKHLTSSYDRLDIYNFNIDIIQALEKYEKDSYLIRVKENSLEILKNLPEYANDFLLLDIYRGILSQVHSVEEAEAAQKYYEPIFKVIDHTNPDDFYWNTEYAHDATINTAKTEVYILLSSNERILQHFKESRKYLNAAEESLQFDGDADDVYHKHLKERIEEENRILNSQENS